MRFLKGSEYLASPTAPLLYLLSPLCVGDRVAFRRISPMIFWNLYEVGRINSFATKTSYTELKLKEDWSYELTNTPNSLDWIHLIKRSRYDSWSYIFFVYIPMSRFTRAYTTPKCHDKSCIYISSCISDLTTISVSTLTLLCCHHLISSYCLFFLIYFYFSITFNCTLLVAFDVLLLFILSDLFVSISHLTVLSWQHLISFSLGEEENQQNTLYSKHKCLKINI